MTTYAEKASPNRTVGILTPEMAWQMAVYCRWYDLALARHGFTTARLDKLARKVAIDALRLRGAVLQERFDDLISRLTIVGLEAARRFDPTREHKSYGSNGGNVFESYLADIMGKRVDDYFRSKAEGFGDRRSGNDGRIVLTDEIDTTEQTDFDFVLDIERVKWQKAARATGQDLDQWMVNALNREARRVLSEAA